MKDKVLCIALLALTGIFNRETQAQEASVRWGFGVGFGAQQLYADGGLKSRGFGLGGDVSFIYRLSNGVGVTLTTGYNQLPFSLSDDAGGDIKFTNKLFFGDFKLDLELLRGFFRPYFVAGVGAFNYNVTSDSTKSGRFTSTAFLGGGGVRLAATPSLVFDLGAHYKYTTDDDLDSGLRGGMGDGFLTLRGGVTFLFGGPAKDNDAIEQAPIVNVETPDSAVAIMDASAHTIEPENEAGRPLETAVYDTSAVHPVLLYGQLSQEMISESLKKPLALDECIRIALSENVLLRVAEGDLETAEATYSGSSGKFYPIFTLDAVIENTLERRPFDPMDPNARLNYSFDNRAVVGGIQQFLPTGATLQLTSDLRQDVNSPDRFGEPSTRTKNQAYSFRLTQPLLRGALPKIARSSINLAEYDWQIQEKELANFKLQMMFSVKSAFYSALLERELIKVHEAAIQRDSTLVKAAESRVQAKLATRLDILSAEIRLARDRAALIKGQTDYQVAIDLLKEVMGLPLESSIELTQMELGFSPVDLDEKRLIGIAMQNNPSIKSAKIAIPRSKLELTVAKNTLLPQLDLIGEYIGRFDVNTDQNKNLSENGWRAGISLTYPIFNREGAANVKNARVNMSQEQDRLVNLQRQIELSIRELVRSIYSSVEEISAIKRSMEAAEEKLDFAMTMYNLGRASNLDITDAQEALVEAQDQYVRKLVEYHTQLALLESLTGQPLTS